MAPKDENELRHMLYSAIKYNQPVAVRYPRGPGFGVDQDEQFKELPIGKGEVLAKGDDITIVGIGNMATYSLMALDILKEKGVSATVINARFVKPLDSKLIIDHGRKTGHILTVEENADMGGFGAAVLESLSQAGVFDVKTKILGVPDLFLEHGTQSQLRDDIELTPKGIAKNALALLEK